MFGSLRKKSWVLILVILVIAVGIAYYEFSTGEEYKTFSHEKLGFQFSYPAAWAVYPLKDPYYFEDVSDSEKKFRFVITRGGLGELRETGKHKVRLNNQSLEFTTNDMLLNGQENPGFPTKMAILKSNSDIFPIPETPEYSFTIYYDKNHEKEAISYFRKIVESFKETPRILEPISYVHDESGVSITYPGDVRLNEAIDLMNGGRDFLKHINLRSFMGETFVSDVTIETLGYNRINPAIGIAVNSEYEKLKNSTSVIAFAPEHGVSKAIIDGQEGLEFYISGGYFAQDMYRKVIIIPLDKYFLSIIGPALPYANIEGVFKVDMSKINPSPLSTEILASKIDFIFNNIKIRKQK